MFFIIFIKPIFPVEQYYFWFNYTRGGSRGTILLVSFGLKFDIIFKKISVNVLTWQFISVLRLR